MTAHVAEVSRQLIEERNAQTSIQLTAGHILSAVAIVERALCVFVTCQVERSPAL